MPSSAESPFPVWIKRWLLFASLVMYYDGFFCCLRPHSLPDGTGWLPVLFRPMKLYLKEDKHYADKNDSLVLAQGICNIVEAGINTAILSQLFSSIRWTKLISICSCIMTCWKSVVCILWSYDLADESRHVEDWFSNITLILLPTVAFITIPAYAAYTLMSDFAAEPKEDKSS